MYSLMTREGQGVKKKKKKKMGESPYRGLDVFRLGFVLDGEDWTFDVDWEFDGDDAFRDSNLDIL